MRLKIFLSFASVLYFVLILLHFLALFVSGEGSIALSDVSEDEEVVLDLSSDDDEVPHNGGLQDKGNDDADVVILEEISESADASK